MMKVNNLYFSMNTFTSAEGKHRFSLMFHEAKELDKYSAPENKKLVF